MLHSAESDMPSIILSQKTSIQRIFAMKNGLHFFFLINAIW
tara:strand:+ start:63 stop:185 length:123 start_codon:yes stop_codon:yes gene_type:complete